MAAPTVEDRSVVFHADDGREITFGLLYDVLVMLDASSWDDRERYYLFRRLAEAMGVSIRVVKT